MELTKIRSLSDDELLHHEKTSGEQLFRLRFQVSMGQNDGVKKLRQLRKEIAQIKTVSRERELGIRGATHELVSTLPAGEEKKSAKKAVKTVKKAAKPATAKTSAKKSTSKSAEKKGAGK
ncbi:MAG: 50S ribosomal protein L29 [Terracidiphilus sp.]